MSYLKQRGDTDFLWMNPPYDKNEPTTLVVYYSSEQGFASLIAGSSLVGNSEPVCKIFSKLHQVEPMNSLPLPTPYFNCTVFSYIAVTIAIYKPINYSFNAMIILILWRFANYISIPIHFPPVRTGLSVKGIWLYSELRKDSFAFWVKNYARFSLVYGISL